MNINHLINELIEYGVSNNLIENDDRIYCSNKLLEFFGVEDFTEEKIFYSRPVHEILEDCITYAGEAGLLTDPTTTEKDLYDTKIMGLITPPPSSVRRLFSLKYRENPQAATEFYYNFSKATNYIRTDRIKRDEKWVTDTDFGALDITINLSKPEKDPRDIAAAGKAKKSGYPSCLLCKENEGYAGHISHPARQNHRVIPIKLCGEAYNLQYSPYVYYNEHCIIFNDEHIPMKIDRLTFAKLLDFVKQFPHYTAGSNADLPIVGGSILSHDHFQGGCYEFPMVRAPYEMMFKIPGYEDINSGVINWPLTTLRLQSESPERLTDAADLILTKWRSYTDTDSFIFSETNGIPHNTITPIARMRENLYELDLVLRNNITTEEHPLGVYHPHSEYHHIKKENIGLIEVMGLAVLPARLKKEMSELHDAILSGHLTAASIREIPSIASHAEWAEDFLKKNNITADRLSELQEDGDKLTPIIRNEVGLVFSHVLEDAGVYKCTPAGRTALKEFLSTL